MLTFSYPHGKIVKRSRETVRNGKKSERAGGRGNAEKNERRGPWKLNNEKKEGPVISESLRLEEGTKEAEPKNLRLEVSDFENELTKLWNRFKGESF